MKLSTEGSGLITIIGLILPVEWDQRGTVQQIAVFTHDEDQYYIEKDKKGNKMLALVHQEAHVSGEIREKAGKKFIRVKKFLIKESEASLSRSGL